MEFLGDVLSDWGMWEGLRGCCVRERGECVCGDVTGDSVDAGGLCGVWMRRGRKKKSVCGGCDG